MVNSLAETSPVVEAISSFCVRTRRPNAEPEIRVVPKQIRRPGERAGAVELHITGRTGCGDRLRDERPDVRHAFKNVPVHVGPAVGVCRAAARTADSPHGIAVLARELSPSHCCYAQQCDCQNKQNGGAVRAPKLQERVEAGLTLRHPSPSQKAEALGSAVGRIVRRWESFTKRPLRRKYATANRAVNNDAICTIKSGPDSIKSLPHPRNPANR